MHPGGEVGCPVLEVHVKRLVLFMREGVFELRALSFFFPNSELYYFPNGRPPSTERKTWQVYSLGKRTARTSTNTVLSSRVTLTLCRSLTAGWTGCPVTGHWPGHFISHTSERSVKTRLRQISSHQKRAGKKEKEKRNEASHQLSASAWFTPGLPLFAAKDRHMTCVHFTDIRTQAHRTPGSLQ